MQETGSTQIVITLDQCKHGVWVLAHAQRACRTQRDGCLERSRYCRCVRSASAPAHASASLRSRRAKQK